MSCQQTQEIDLVTFLADASRGEFAAFREHYPTCAECSAEVRAWTELHLLLGADRAGVEAAHPTEERLLRFEDSPEALPSSERRALEAHLEVCPSCADELRALRGFDFAQLGASPVPATSAWRRLLETGLARARGLVWHPAFAYALVLILLYPIVSREWRESTLSPGASGIHALEEGGLEPREAARAIVLRDERADADAQAPPAPRGALMREGDAAAPEIPAAHASQKRSQVPAQARGAPARMPSKEKAIAPERARNQALARGGRMELAPRALERRDALGSALERSLAAFAEVGTPEITLERDELTELYGADVRGGLRLRLPVPSAVPAGAQIELRVVGPEGRRELRERLRLGAGQTQVELRLPPGWVSAGKHAVELRVIDGERESAPHFRASFAVHL